MFMLFVWGGFGQEGFYELDGDGGLDTKGRIGF